MGLDCIEKSNACVLFWAKRRSAGEPLEIATLDFAYPTGALDTKTYSSLLAPDRFEQLTLIVNRRLCEFLAKSHCQIRCALGMV